jgi:serine/threonine protein phosphatase PrpC
VSFSSLLLVFLFILLFFGFRKSTDHSKPNQDAFSHTTNFASQKSDAFFAVYDGHGRDGEKCAQYSREMLPTVLARVVKEMKLELCHDESENGVPMFTDVELGKMQVQHACTKSHLMVNAGLRENGDIDDTLSGTTAVSVLLQGRLNRITVSNVGDSRAVLGRRVWKESEERRYLEDGSTVYKAIPLSRDQTPHSKVERKRIRACGARILSLDQIEGLEPLKLDDNKVDDKDNDGIDENNTDNHNLEEEEEDDFNENDDPPRVWHPTMDYPGTAFTRSLGDALAKELGVIAEPEMVTMDLDEGDEIIVLATDGVFEFLTNQSVIDICAKFKDPLDACRAVISQAYQLWLQYELRTDDITMICIFMDSIRKEQQEQSRSHSSLHRASLDASDCISFETEKEAKDESKVQKRCAEIKDMLKESLHQTPFKERSNKMPFLKTEKSNEEKDVLNHAIKRSLILQNMSKKQLEMTYSAMQPMHVKKGDWIICQGEEGNCLYIAEEGKFEARLVSGGSQYTDQGGKVVHVYEASKEKNIFPCFGELSLLYSSPRAASIVAMTDGKLWVLHRVALKAIMNE